MPDFILPWHEPWFLWTVGIAAWFVIGALTCGVLAACFSDDGHMPPDIWAATVTFGMFTWPVTWLVAIAACIAWLSYRFIRGLQGGTDKK